MGRRKKKTKYDVKTTLKASRLDPEIEELARNLYASACCAANELAEERAKKNQEFTPELRKEFMTAAHNGMWEAQNKIVSFFKREEELSDSHELLFRSIMDSIAWQLLGYQLCYARALFKGHAQPSLKHSNFDSVVFSANDYVTQHPGSMSVISDLTSFIQVGDLYSVCPENGVSIAEVKEGKKNHTIMEFMKFYLEHGCDRSLYYFAEKEGDHAVKQMQRMMRQASRMAHYSKLMGKGEAVDPDSEVKKTIPEEYIHVDQWMDQLNNILAASEEKGWALATVDECLFLACYSSETTLCAGHILFNSWFDGLGGTSNCPRARLLDTLHYPLALTIFNLNIPTEYKFDLLFGRKNVCMGLNIEALIKQCEKAGLKVRFGTNREASQLDQMGQSPHRHKGKAIFIGNGITEMVLMDGIFERVMFHNQRPIQLIQSFLDKISEDQ